MGDNFSEFCIQFRQFILIGRAVFRIGSRVRRIFLCQHLRQHAGQLFRIDRGCPDVLVIFNLDAVTIVLIQILLSVIFIMNRHIFHIMLILAVNMLFCVVFFFTVNMVLWLMFFFTVSMIFRLMIVITRMNCSIRMNMRMSMIVRLSIFHALDDLLLHYIHAVHHRHDALRSGAFPEGIKHLRKPLFHRTAVAD